MPYDIGSGLASFGNDIADAMQEYHKKHEAYNQAEGVANALSRLGIDEQGNITPVTGPDGKPLKNITPILDPKAVEMFKSRVGNDRSRAQGALEALSRIGIGTASKAISQRLEDASVSGQRTKQIMEQDKTMFPLDVEAKKASIEHLKKITNEEGKIPVPGFGLMTPSQLSLHNARMERLKILQQKTEPARNFENQLNSAYGLKIQDIIAAAKPQEFTDPRGNKYKGTPYYDSTGTLVSKEVAKKKPEETFVLAGPDKVPIPILDKKGKLGWTQIAPKAASMQRQLDEHGPELDKMNVQLQQQQAQAVIAHIQQKDPSTLTPADQAALAKAQAVLGQ